MATPASLKPSPVVSLGDFSFKSLFEDDYSTDKSNFKVKAVTGQQGTVNYKLAFDHKKLKVAQEVKVQFPYKRYFFWLGAKDSNAFKVHFDLGEITLLKKFNLYMNLKNSGAFRVGLVHDGTCQSHFRLEKDPEGSRYLITSRAQTKKNNFVFSFAGTLDLKHLWPTRTDFLVGYQQKDYDLYLRYFSNTADWTSRFKFGRLVADLLYRRNDQVFGLEADFDEDLARFKSVSLAASKVVRKATIKGSADVLSKELKFSLKGKCNNTFGYTFSALLPLDGNLKKKFPPFPVGFTLETVI